MATATLATLETLRSELVNSRYYLNIRSGYMAPVTLHCSYGDSGESVTFYIFDGSDKLSLDGSAASVHGTRIDGAVFGPIACQTEDNKVTFNITSEMTAVEGSAIAEIVITKGSTTVGTCNFGILIENAAFPNGVSYDTDPSVYMNILKYVQTIPASLEGSFTRRINSEVNSRTAGDDYLKSRIAAEEGARQSADAALSSRIDNIVSPSGAAPSATEVTDARTAFDGAVYSNLGTAIRTVTGDLDADRDKMMSYGGNLLDPTKITAGYYINTSNGNLVAYDTYYTSDFMPVTPGTVYSMVSLTSASSYTVYTPVTNGEYAFYTASKTFISGGTRTASSYTMTAPSNAKYIRISKVYTDGSNKDICGEHNTVRTFDDAYPESGSAEKSEWEYITPNAYPIANKLTIKKILQPYVVRDWQGYWYFKFYSIVYTDYDNSENAFYYETIKTHMYPSLIQRSTTRVTGCTYLADGKALVFREYSRQLEVVSNIANKDVVLLYVDGTNAYGLLYDAYLAELQTYTERSVYKELPVSVLNTMDTSVTNMGFNGLLSEPNKFSFIHVSDNHHLGAHTGIESNLTAMAIKYLHSRLHFDAILNTGDELLTNNTGGNPHVALGNAINAYPVEDMVFCEGNHDRGIIEPLITHKQYYNYVIRQWKDNENVHTVYPKSYYYRDYPDKKIRIVCVTLYDIPDESFDQYPYNDYCGYDQTQMEWLCNTALRIDSDWSVIVMVHSAPVTTAEGNTGNGTAGQNPLVLRQILESFKNGTNATVTHSSTVANGFFNISLSTGFASQGARNLVGVFSGHTHLDRIVKINTISYDAICCGYIDIVEYGGTGTRGTRTAFDYSAICFDVGIVDTSAKSVNLYRIGFVPTDSTATRSWTY